MVDLSFRWSHPNQNRNSKLEGKGRRQLAAEILARKRKDCCEERNEKLIKADTRTQKSELYNHLVSLSKTAFSLPLAFS